VIFGGIFSSTRQAIKGPAVLIPWLIQRTGAKTFYLPSADYIWPRVLNRKVHEVATAHDGAILGEEYFPLDHGDYRECVERIMSSEAEVVFNMTVPPGVIPLPEQLYDAGFTKRGGQIVCRYFDENCLNLVPAHTSRACTAASTTTRMSVSRSVRNCSVATTSASPAVRCSRVGVPAPACTEV
jgi:ABC-type branched-subunit amino acid transport system substrate-binding protein